MNMGNAAVELHKKKVDTIRDLLDRSKQQIAACLPRHLTAERMVRVAITAVQRTPELLECEPLSIVGCVMLASQLGLELDNVLGQAYLVPFYNSKTGKKEAQFLVGYKGYLELARRSDRVAIFRPSVAYANETFHWTEGTDCKITHVPRLANRGAPVAVYAMIQLKDGSKDFEVVPWETVLQCQNEYGHFQQGKRKGEKKPGPWWTHLEEMARKTAIRRLAKRVPVSIEMQRAAALDELAEAELPQHDLAELPVTRTDEVVAMLAAQTPLVENDDVGERAAIEAEGQK